MVLLRQEQSVQSSKVLSTEYLIFSFSFPPTTSFFILVHFTHDLLNLSLLINMKTTFFAACAVTATLFQLAAAAPLAQASDASASQGICQYRSFSEVATDKECRLNQHHVRNHYLYHP